MEPLVLLVVTAECLVLLLSLLVLLVVLDWCRHCCCTTMLCCWGGFSRCSEPRAAVIHRGAELSTENPVIHRKSPCRKTTHNRGELSTKLHRKNPQDAHAKGMPEKLRLIAKFFCIFLVFLLALVSLMAYHELHKPETEHAAMFKTILAFIASFQESRESARRAHIKAVYAARVAARKEREHAAQGAAVAAWSDAVYAPINRATK